MIKQFLNQYVIGSGVFWNLLDKWMIKRDLFFKEMLQID